MTGLTRDGVTRVAACDLRVSDDAWAFAATNADAIDAHWAAALRVNPGYFNGVIYLVRDAAIAAGILRATLLRTDFKSFLYWRDSGFPQAGVRDGFGSALIRDASGAVILGRQRAGHINAGLAYLPGGFIDARDVTADGRIDIAASVAREVAEETGLDGTQVEPEPGFLITSSGPQLSIAVEYRTRQPAEAIATHIAAHIAADADPELADAVIVRSVADLTGLAMPPYAKVLLRALFAAEGVAPA